MAKVQPPDEPFSRMAQVKSPGRFHLQGWKGKIYARKWPARNRRVKYDTQQAWIDRFGCLACILKYPDGITRRQADDYAEGSGWYWRDVLHAAASGKLIRFQELKQIMTPTASLSRLTNQSVPSGTATPIQFTAEQWDNNNFWVSSQNTRITVRSGGLYLLGYFGEWTQFLNGFRGMWFRLNGDNTKLFARIGEQVGAATLTREQASTIYYFNKDDYFELIASSGTAGEQIQVPQCWIVAITPETIQ